MRSVTHLRYEVIRTVRNRMFFAFTLALPLVSFCSARWHRRNAMP